MSDAPLETLLRPFDQGLLPLPTATQRVLVLRARRHRLWRHLPAEALTLTQPFKPAADELQADGWQVADEQQALQDVGANKAALEAQRESLDKHYQDLTALQRACSTHRLLLRRHAKAL